MQTNGDMETKEKKEKKEVLGLDCDDDIEEEQRTGFLTSAPVIFSLTPNVTSTSAPVIFSRLTPSTASGAASLGATTVSLSAILRQALQPLQGTSPSTTLRKPKPKPNGKDEKDE